MLWFRRSPTSQLRSRTFPFHSRSTTSRRQIISRWQGSIAKRLLGTQNHRVAGIYCHNLLDTRGFLPGLGQILRFSWSDDVRPPRAYSTGRSRTYMGRILLGEDRELRLQGMEVDLDRLYAWDVYPFVCHDHRHVHLFRKQWLRDEPSCNYRTFSSPPIPKRPLTSQQVNLLVLLIISAISVHPTIQEYNPQAGLAQSAMVAIYCTYLTMSAVSMEPDDHQCNPLIRARGTRTASIIIGAVVTMLTIAYTTTRAATQGIALGSQTSHSYSKIGQEDSEHGMVDQQPSGSRREMRAEALRAAVEAGSLPANALDDDDDDDESNDGHGGKDDERSGTQYN